MFKCGALALLAVLGLCIGVCADESLERFDPESSDDASLLQVSRTDVSMQSAGSAVQPFLPTKSASSQLFASVVAEFRAEGTGKCEVSPYQAKANEKGWRKFSAPFSGCWRFWHCVGNALALVAPFSVICCIIMIALSLWVWLYEIPESKAMEDTPSPPTLQAGEPMPTVLRRMILVCNVMVNVNFTIMMPTSSSVVDSKGGSLSLSGVLIGSYSIGTLMAIPLMIRCSLISYRLGFICTALAAVAGNLTWCYASTLTAAAPLLLARVLCGFEGGVLILFNNILMACSTGMARMQMGAQMSAAGCLGLLLGPSMSSFAGQLFGETRAALLSAQFMTLWAGIFLLVAAYVVPYRADVVRFESKQSFSENPVPRRACWLSFSFLTCSMFARGFQRVLWEAAFLVIVADGFKYGTVASGYMTTIPLILLLIMPLVGKPLVQKYGTVGYIMIMDAMQIFGIVLMFHMGIPHPFRIVVFIFGSAIFYFANWAQIVAVAPFQAYFAVPDHPILALERIPAWTWGLSFIGYFFGPIVSRMLLQACPNQDILGTALLISAGGILFGQKIALDMLKPWLPDIKKA